MNRPNVFTDFHHAGLLRSLILLFERRFSGQVYRPIGREWWERGYWKVYDHPATVEQFLGIGGATPDGTEPVNKVVNMDKEMVVNGANWKEWTVYHCFDIDSHESNKAITLEGFFNTRFDFVVASIPAHIEPFRKLCNEHPSRPKLIYQIGNAWNVSNDQAQLIDAVLASARITESMPTGVPIISYHQEFDLDIFYPSIPRSGQLTANWKYGEMPSQNIFSFINCFNIDRLFEHDWQLFEKVERLMPDWNFKAYGGQCRDGAAHGARELSTAMRSARFIWHTKNGGDGYGHIIHNSAAAARPTLVKREYYAGKLAESLLVDGVTCVAIDGLGPDEIKNKIEYFSDPDRYAVMCEAVYQNFKRVVDFNGEANSISAFLESLV